METQYIVQGFGAGKRAGKRGRVEALPPAFVEVCMYSGGDQKSLSVQAARARPPISISSSGASIAG